MSSRKGIMPSTHFFGRTKKEAIPGQIYYGEVLDKRGTPNGIEPARLVVRFGSSQGGPPIVYQLPLKSNHEIDFSPGYKVLIEFKSKPNFSRPQSEWPDWWVIAVSGSRSFV